MTRTSTTSALADVDGICRRSARHGIGVQRSGLRRSSRLIAPRKRRKRLPDGSRIAWRQARVPAVELSHKVETTPGKVSIGTMHLAKGLEFRSVAVMACDDEVIPLQDRLDHVADEADLEEVYNSERHLLYVACTRARDHLLVTGVNPASEFLDGLSK